MAPAYTHLVPLGELNFGQVTAIRNKVMEATIAKATREVRGSVDDLVVRDIRPKDDMNFTYESFGVVTGSSTGQYETLDSGTMGDQRYIGIYGVKINSPAPAVSMLRFSVGGAEKVIWLLQHLNGEDGYVGICPSGIIIPQNITYSIEQYVLDASVASIVALKGFVVEKRGLVVSP